MDPVSTPRLDAYDRMQNTPVGASSSLRRDPATVDVGRDYRRTKEEYGHARRLLRKIARAGSTNAALKLIDLRKDAASQGITLGGMTRPNETQGTIASRTASVKQGVSDLERVTSGGPMAGVQGASGVQGSSSLSAGRSTFAADNLARAERERRLRRAGEQAGRFGASAQNRASAASDNWTANDPSWWSKR